MVKSMKILFVAILLIFAVSCEVLINSEVNFAISDETLDFGYAEVHSKISKEISIKNIGTKECELSSISIDFYDSSTTNTEYKIIDGNLQNSVSFAQNDEHKISVQFHPINSGSKIANLKIEYIVNSEASVLTIPLSGIGYNNFVYVQPALVSFSPLYIGENEPKQIVITNNEPKPLTVNSVNIGNFSPNTISGEFKVTSGWNGNSIVINPSDSINITVEFSPTNLSTKHAVLVVKLDGSSLDFNCTLTGECIPKLQFVTSENLPNAIHGQAYSTIIDYKGGGGNSTISVTNNDLPKGLQLNSGVINGTPKEHGFFKFWLTLKDGSGHSINKMFTVEINYARLYRDPSDVDPMHIFQQSNKTGYYTINLIAEGDVSLKVNSITLTGAGVTSGEATIDSQPPLPLTMFPGTKIQIVIKVVSLLDAGRKIELTVNHTGYNSPFNKEFEWHVLKFKYVFILDRSGSMDSRFSNGTPVYDANGNIIPYPTRLQAVQSEIASRVKALTPDCMFDVIAFRSSTTLVCFNSLRSATIQNKTAALTWLFNLSCGGGTLFYDPLNIAFNNYGPVDEILFFSDGCPGDAAKTLTAMSGWVNTQVSYNPNFLFQAIQIGGSPIIVMIRMGALPNCQFQLY